MDKLFGHYIFYYYIWGKKDILNDDDFLSFFFTLLFGPLIVQNPPTPTPLIGRPWLRLNRGD